MAEKEETKNYDENFLTKKIVKCKYCRKRFNLIDELARHYEVRHKIRRPYAAAVFQSFLIVSVGF